MLIRYFAAAAASTGMEAEHLQLPNGATMADLRTEMARLHTVSSTDHAPALAQLLERCSFLRNGIAVKDTQLALDTDDVVDVLPPFAGG